MVVSDAEVDETEDDNEERLCLLGSTVYMHMNFTVLKRRPLKGKKGLVEPSTMRSARLDA